MLYRCTLHICLATCQLDKNLQCGDIPTYKMATDNVMQITRQATSHAQIESSAGVTIMFETKEFVGCVALDQDC